VGEGQQYAKNSNTQKNSPLSTSHLNMASKDAQIEAKIAEASAAMDANPRLRGVKAATQFGVSYDRLMARRRGRPNSSSRGGHNKKLNEVQSSALKEYILMLHACGTSANLETCRLAAGRLLYYETGDPNIQVSIR